MFQWIPYPFVRIVFSLVAGILFGIRLPEIIPIGVATAMLLLAAVLTVTCVLSNAAAKRVVVNPGPVTFATFIFLGYVNVWHTTDSHDKEHLLNIDECEAYTAIVVSSHEHAKSSWKQLVQVKQVLVHGRWTNSRGRILLYYDTGSFSAPFRYGDLLLIDGSPRVVSGASNPHAFDYRRFLANRNIYHQHFVRGNNIGTIKHDPPSLLIDFAIRTRLWARDILYERIGGDHERAIVAALVLGVTDGLDADITGAYAASGAMHVLAVSGLHVGIIFLLLGTAFKPLLRLRGGKWILMLVSLAVLWGYACVTGLSPSVLRAVTMFSFVAAAQPLGYRTNIYNTLAASAFFLLLFDPYLIMAVGFQLSYAAVLSIVYFHPLLYNLLEPRSRILDYIWNISAVSIAAQLGTFPIGLFYFHQFPTYFLLANLFVIPLAFGILLGGLLVIAVHAIPIVGELTGFLVEWLIWFLNKLIFLVEGLPFAVINGMAPTFNQCILIAVTIVTTTLFLERRKLYFALISLASVIFFGIDQWVIHARTFVEPRIVVYQVANHRVVDMIKGGTAYCFADSAQANNEAATAYQVSPNRLALGISRVLAGERQSFVRNFQGGSVIRWEGRTILLLNELPDELNALDVDYLIVSGSATRNLSGVLKKIKAHKVILDSSNSYFVTNKSLNSLTQAMPIHSVWHHGAFEINW